MKKILMSAAVILSLTATGQEDSTKLIEQSEPASNPFTFSGYVEGYYNYDFNQPVNNTRPGFLYSHNRHNEFNVNLAFLKGSYNAERVRANLAVAVGSYMNANYAAEPATLKNIYEANAGYNLAVQKTSGWISVSCHHT